MGDMFLIWHRNHKGKVAQFYVPENLLVLLFLSWCSRERSKQNSSSAKPHSEVRLL